MRRPPVWLVLDAVIAALGVGWSFAMPRGFRWDLLIAAAIFVTVDAMRHLRARR